MEKKEEYKSCSYCYGTGYVTKMIPMPMGKIMTMMPQRRTCTYCNGKGKVKK